MNLTDTQIKNLKTKGRYADGNSLFLEIRDNGGKYWRLRYRFAGRENVLALGVYPKVSLKEAREKAQAAKKSLQLGANPSEQRKAEKARVLHEQVNTLEAVAKDWLNHQSTRWGEGTKIAIIASLVNHVYPALGNKPMASIKPIEVIAAVKKIEASGGGDIANRVMQRIKEIYRFALVHERIETNPMLDLIPREILKPRETKHRDALPESELPEFLKKLAAYDGDPTTIYALRLLILTACRPGEVRGALWAEIDFDAALWTIPAERMKMRSEHKVPLSRQAIEILKNMQQHSGNSSLVFPSPSYRSKPLSENTFNSALARMGYKSIATAHGFRSLFSTVANEANWDADVIERQLAHTERNKVRAAYHRASYIPERIKLMQWWADWIDARAQGGQVIPIGSKRSKAA